MNKPRTYYMAWGQGHVKGFDTWEELEAFGRKARGLDFEIKIFGRGNDPTEADITCPVCLKAFQRRKKK